MKQIDIRNKVLRNPDDYKLFRELNNLDSCYESMIEFYKSDFKSNLILLDDYNFDKLFNN